MDIKEIALEITKKIIDRMPKIGTKPSEKVAEEYAQIYIKVLKELEKEIKT